MKKLSDKEIERYLENVRKNWMNIQKIPEEILIQYPRICIQAFIGDMRSIRYIPDEVLIEHPHICLEALKYNIEYIDSIPNEVLMKYPDICIKILKQNIECIDYIPDELLAELKDPEICIKAVKLDPWLVGLFSSEMLLEYPQICIEAVRQNGNSITVLPTQILVKYPSICMEAVKQNGSNIRYIPDKVLKKHPEISAEGIKNYAEGIKYIINNNEEKALLLAARKNRGILYFVDEYKKSYILSQLKEENKNNNWQRDCLSAIRNKQNVILSSPTGSGKTRVYLEWAKQKNNKPIYITSPIKVLSNQRYRELIQDGYIVGIETGDIKNVPDNCDFICCTQEVYTNKYLEQEDVTLIIDEFHHIFENKERARSYIDALHNSRATNILICSATLGEIDKLREYLEKISGREFYSYENKSRLTELNYRGEIKSEDIKNALVVAFSKENCEFIADKIAARRKNNRNKANKIEKFAKKYNVSYDYNIKKGIATYYGSMLPKEKLFIEKLFENKLIDTVVGTDALALGVNFPVENVVFTQLAKYNKGSISKNLFEQLAGRAGRKGFYDNGYIYYCKEFKIDAKPYKVEDLYEKLLEKENEDITIELTPNIKAILQKKTTIEKEVEYISKYSTEYVDKEKLRRDLEKTIHDIENYDFIDSVIKEEFYQDKTNNDDNNDNNVIDMEDVKKRKMELIPIQGEFAQNISEVYFEGFTAKENCEIFRKILLDKTNLIESCEGSYKELLQLREYARLLPKKYRKAIDIVQLEEQINDIDDTILNAGRNMLSMDEISKGTKEEQIATEKINQAFKIMDRQVSTRELKSK